MHLGILGGTFNPPHLGHLAVATHALEQLRCERVLLMPSHTPPHKQPQQDPGPRHRLRMCELAVHGHHGLEAGALEIERGGPSYTVDTLKALHAHLGSNCPASFRSGGAHDGSDRPTSPGSDLPAAAARLTLILGSDMARTLPSWRRAGEIVELADIAVAERPGDGRQQVLAVLESLSARASFLEMPAIDVSSSMVRERVARGESVAELVAPAVAAYIAEHELYLKRSGVPAS
ncbi:MAG TPA: nicotinate (nicotinamide) nucleotide adenylyltransferase [Solirubrobacteraceae bacterium]|jgi:nicotinate-nucleotide adenylyltransferase